MRRAPRRQGRRGPRSLVPGSARAQDVGARASRGPGLRRPGQRGPRSPAPGPARAQDFGAQAGEGPGLRRQGLCGALTGRGPSPRRLARGLQRPHEALAASPPWRA